MRTFKRLPIITTSLAIAMSLGMSGSALAQETLDNSMKVTLLGTGSPNPSPDRFSQSILVEAGEQKLLIDLGRGVTIRLAQLGVPFSEIDASFITHMHSDHLTGLPDLWMTGWLATPYASRKEPMRLYGPKGTESMAANLTEAFAEDIRIRKLDEELPPEGIAFDAKNITAGQVYNEEGVKVTAFETEHGELIKPSYGYTITYNGHKVVIPSDTVYDENIAEVAKGTDLLIHEVAMIDPGVMKKYPKLENVMNHHTSPEDAGRVFNKAKPELAAYTHYVIFNKDRKVDSSTYDRIKELTRTTYDGPLVTGHDLTTFVINNEGVSAKNAEGEEIITVPSDRSD
ncbi:MBL fold metallo-hydrolase [Modicisalibacter radicis]|uniref:MBL fold metallo-hydrolase n=1 Tax=Halomonas sp. EAR18 TaxID=2518972 RepID=UPI001B34A4A2|nr:MBL fold metallo-hydrolase [Halomonas sp. EAR18]